MLFILSFFVCLTLAKCSMCHSSSDIATMSLKEKELACLDQLLNVTNVRQCRYAKVNQIHFQKEICDIQDETDLKELICKRSPICVSSWKKNSLCYSNILKPCLASTFNHRCFPQKGQDESFLCLCRSNDHLPCFEHEDVTRSQVGDTIEYCAGGVCCATDTPNKDCSDPGIGNGVYQIVPSETDKAHFVYCNHTHGYGGIVFQRRIDGSENFYREWKDYVGGFGNLEKEFWLGNDLLAVITNKKNYKLYVDMEDFSGEHRYAVYDSFRIESATNKYKLHLGDYIDGDAGDSLKNYVNGIDQLKFSTKDQDNDLASKNCAVTYMGGWWYRACHAANPNGRYDIAENTISGEGINWHSFRLLSYSLKSMQLMLVPK